MAAVSARIPGPDGRMLGERHRRWGRYSPGRVDDVSGDDDGDGGGAVIDRG